MLTTTTVCYRFGQFELQPHERRLLAAGTPVALAPRAFNLLVALVEREGGLATKEQLLAQVWPGMIVEENALHAQISTLRKVLGADAIATVAGAGYRFALALTKPEAASESTTEAAPRHNLARQLTSFIGREQQIAELKALLERTQLLTLSGMGGCGKTRLAMELAYQVSGAYADGVWLVELAALADAQLVPHSVADVLGLKERVGEDLAQTLQTHLAARHVLLVLDNAEHLLVACAEIVSMLLQRCARLTVVVTSRERLGILGEITYRVPSLSVPDPHRMHAAETLMAYESARLFIERARLQQPHFALTAQSMPAITSICTHLDGIPLAIELAAARVRALSVEEVNQRLDQRFRLLTDASRAALPRHRTLGALIDWSYDLLNEAEKELCNRASVFAGGFALEAADRVLSGGAVDEAAMVDLLTSLVDKNLLQAEDRGGTTRYRQLETVRQYGLDRLRRSAEEVACRQRHLAYFVALAESAEDGLRGGKWQTWIERLREENENLRVALASALEPDGDPEGGLRLAGALYPFWFNVGYFSEGRGWLLRALEAVPAGQVKGARAKALNAAGSLAHMQSDNHLARALLEECLVIRRTLADRRGIAVALKNLGDVLWMFGDLAAARKLMEESLAFVREIGNGWGVARVLLSLVGVMLAQGEAGLARALAQECVDLERQLGGMAEGHAVANLSEVVLAEGDAQAAMSLCREVLAKSTGRLETTGRFETLLLLESTACAHAALGDTAEAALIWGHCERLRQDFDMSSYISWPPSELLRHERAVSSARAAHEDDGEFDNAWRRGASMTTEQLIESVLRSNEA